MGGANVYSFVGNSAIKRIDLLGLADCSEEKRKLDLHEEAVKNILQRILNIRLQIAERMLEQFQDRLGLPQDHLPGMKLRESVEGHELLIDRLIEAERAAERQLQVQQTLRDAAKARYSDCLKRVVKECEEKNLTSRVA